MVYLAYNWYISCCTGGVSMIPIVQRIAIANVIVDGALSSREAAEKYGSALSLAAKEATVLSSRNYGLPVRTSTPRTPVTNAIMLASSNDSFHLEAIISQ